MRTKLHEHGYVSVIFDFERPANRDVTETVATLAHLAKFIIADITSPRSIPQELATVIPGLAVPVQPLLESSELPYGMFADFSKYHWVLPIHRYADQADLLASLEERVIRPAEMKAIELKNAASRGSATV